MSRLTEVIHAPPPKTTRAKEPTSGRLRLVRSEILLIRPPCNQVTLLRFLNKRFSSVRLHAHDVEALVVCGRAHQLDTFVMRKLFAQVFAPVVSAAVCARTTLPAGRNRVV